MNKALEKAICAWSRVGIYITPRTLYHGVDAIDMLPLVICSWDRVIPEFKTQRVITRAPDGSMDEWDDQMVLEKNIVDALKPFITDQEVAELLRDKRLKGKPD